jgi:hypothetical protein
MIFSYTNNLPELDLHTEDCKEKLSLPNKVFVMIRRLYIPVYGSAFFKEFSLGGQNRGKRQNEKYESMFGERASLKRDFVKL